MKFKSLLRTGFLPLIGLWLGSTPALASKGTLKASERKQTGPDDTSYNDCRNKVLADLKAKKTDITTAKKELKQCSVQFPAAAVYTDCKANVVQKFGKNPKLARAKLKDCKSMRSASKYDPTDPVPFYKVGTRVFYAGADLSFDVDAKLSGKLPGFNCDYISDIFEDIDEPEYLLLGNEPGVFKAFAGLKVKQIVEKLKAKKRKDDDDVYYDFKNVGRMYGDEGKRPLLFFPTSHCFFAGDFGDFFDDHKIYFLVDRKSRQMTPYFGASFFKKDQVLIKTDAVIDSLKEKLGASYQAFPKKAGLTFIAKAAPEEFDSEGDPKNVCSRKKEQDLMAIVRADPKHPQKPQTLIIANIRNLCRFGEGLAQKALLQ